VIASAIKILVVFTALMSGVALLTLVERRVCAWMQDRLGPNRVGPFGLFQPVADGLKNFLKEETYPALADRVLVMRDGRLVGEVAGDALSAERVMRLALAAG